MAKKKGGRGRNTQQAPAQNNQNTTASSNAKSGGLSDEDQKLLEMAKKAKLDAEPEIA